MKKRGERPVAAEHHAEKEYLPEKDPDFLADYMKASIVEDVLQAMQEEGLNRLQLAKRLGRSRQYVGRVLNEKANLTIESLARLAVALDREMVLRMRRREDA